MRWWTDGNMAKVGEPTAKGIIINEGKCDNGYEKRWPGNLTDIGRPLHVSLDLYWKHKIKIDATDRQYTRTVRRASYSVLPVLIFFLYLFLSFLFGSPKHPEHMPLRK